MAISEARSTTAKTADAVAAKSAPDELLQLLQAASQGDAEAILSALRESSLEALRKNAPAHLKVMEGPDLSYQPHFEVYLPNQANDKRAQAVRTFESASKPGARRLGKLDLIVVAKDGIRERITLGAEHARAFLEASASDRFALLNEAIGERRWNLARAAVRKITEGANLREVLTPAEEACLRGWGFLYERTVVEELREGGFRTETFSYTLHERAVDILTRNERPPEKLREDLFAGLDLGVPAAFASGVTPMTAPYLDSEFLPNWGYGTAQNVIISDVWDEQAKAEFAYRRDAVAKKGVHAIRDFTLGRGVKIRCKSKAAQAVVDEFEKRNKLKTRFKWWMVTGSKMGELFVRKFKMGDGRMKVRSVMPDTILEIITDAEDIEDVKWYVQGYQTRIMAYTEDIPADSEPRYIWRHIPGDEVIHAKLNCDEADIRGRSDIFAALPWLKATRDLLYTFVQKEQTLGAFVWDVLVKGGPADINRVLQSLPQGKTDPGSAHVHNEAVEIKVAEPSRSSSSATGSNSMYEGMLNHCSIAFEIPREYLGSGSRNTRANTLVASDPTIKRFGERQDWFADEIIFPLITDVLQEAQLYGLIPKDDSLEFTIVFPQVFKADAEMVTKNLALGVAMGWLSVRRAAERFYSEWDFEDLDFDTIISEREKEAENPVLATIAANFAQVMNAVWDVQAQMQAGAPPVGPLPRKKGGSGPPAGDIVGMDAAASADDKATPSSASGRGAVDKASGRGKGGKQS